MLREVKTAHIHARLTDFYVTTSGGNSVTVNEGSNDLTAAESAAGLPVLTLKQQYANLRNALIFSTPGSTSGSYGTQNAASTASVLSPRLNNSSGTATDGQLQGIIYGWRSSDLSKVLGQFVTSSERRQRLIGGIISSAGVVTFGARDFACTRSGTGQYDVTFLRAGSQNPIVVCTASSATTTARAIRTNGQLAIVGSQQTAASGRIFITDESGTPQNSEFHIIMSVNDIRDDHGGAFARVRNPQRKPSIIAGQLTPGVSPSMAIGSFDMTPTQTSTGIYVFTFATTVTGNAPFKQPPVVMVCANNTRSMIQAVTTNTVTVRFSNASNVATDPTTADIFCLGTNDGTEY